MYPTVGPDSRSMVLKTSNARSACPHLSQTLSKQLYDTVLGCTPARRMPAATEVLCKRSVGCELLSRSSKMNLYLRLLAVTHDLYTAAAMKTLSIEAQCHDSVSSMSPDLYAYTAHLSPAAADQRTCQVGRLFAGVLT